MNYINRMFKNIDLTLINNLESKYRELAIAKMVSMEVSKKYFRDETFFLFKENLIQREIIYNKELSEEEFNVTCISICKVMKKILKDFFGIDTELVTLSKDKYAHIDLMLICNDGKKYILNPLMDLIDFKVRKKTTYFATKFSADMYREKFPDISFLTEEEIMQIDNKINYLIDGRYFVDIHRYNEINEKNLLEVINYILSNRLYINGIVDLKMFASSQIRKAFDKKINVDDFYFYKNAEDFNSLEFCDADGKQRGLLIEYGSNVYIFPTHDNSYLEMSANEWHTLVNKNQIIINKFIVLDKLNNLKQFHTDRNIIHNKIFLKIFKEYENMAKKDNKNILDFISYTSNSINIKFNCDLLFYIKNNNLVMVDRFNNKVVEFIYFNENKVKTVVSNLSNNNNVDKEREYILKTDVLGVFELNPNSSSIIPYITNIDGNNYLSRNYEQYYIFEDEKDLLSRRDVLINILLRDNNLTQDEKYILLENIMNISARIYYLSCINNVIDKNNQNYLENQGCFVNDITNFINFINGVNIDMTFNTFKETNYSFDVFDILSKKKQIELDNKIFVYNYVRLLNSILKKLDIRKYLIVTPGFGSMYLGPFMSAMYNIDFCNLLYSQYKKTGIIKIDNWSNIFYLVTNNEIIKKQKLILLDDNIGTGTTMKKIREELEKHGYNICLCGAYQYTFDRLQEYSIKSRNQELFNPLEIDLLTPINYPRHQIIETAVAKLSISAGDYIDYLKMFGYHSNNCSDFERMILDSLYFYHRYRGVSIENDSELKESSKKLIRKIIPEDMSKMRREYL